MFFIITFVIEKNSLGARECNKREFYFIIFFIIDCYFFLLLAIFFFILLKHLFSMTLSRDTGRKVLTR